jgi:hypothetical protein
MGTYEGAPYLASELLEGETLREQVKRGRLPVAGESPFNRFLYPFRNRQQIRIHPRSRNAS